jgi:uncharacterized membrane protein
MMRHFTKTIEIAAPPERIWPVMTDIERWPEWTPSVTSIKKLDGKPFGVGSRARVTQPKLRPALWRVSEIEAGRGFTWVSGIPILRVIGRHVIEAFGTGSRVTLSVEFQGFLGWLAARAFGKLTRQYVEMEAAGLKRRCEAS